MKRGILTNPTEPPTWNRHRGDQFLTSISVSIEVFYLYATPTSYYLCKLFDFPESLLSASAFRDNNIVDAKRTGANPYLYPASAWFKSVSSYLLYLLTFLVVFLCPSRQTQG
jgi:hypothetical protein